MNRSGFKRLLIDGLMVGAAIVFVASYFPPRLILAETTTNGGDMASHVHSAVYLAHVLLPEGKVTGWCPGNLNGFPLFQFYFPLGFLLIAALGAALPLLVAFKIGTVLGSILLPLSAYVSFRVLGLPFPAPALAALSTLPFLFITSNSVWGGNLPSLLSGEFAYSLGFALAPLALALIRRVIARRRGIGTAGFAVAAVGFAHGYPLLWVGFTSLAEILTRRWFRVALLLGGIHGLAILLLAAWLVPLLGYAPWTTTYSDAWGASWAQALPAILRPSAVFAITLAPLALYWSRSADERRGLTLWWTGIAVSGALYFVGPAVGVVDIRFLPFAQLSLGFAAAAALGITVARFPSAEIWPAALALAIFPFVQLHEGSIPQWIEWNYSGFEQKPTWPTLRALSTHLRGDFRDPRVAYEHSVHHDALGTIRTFENLPLLSGRSTLEGVYLQASPTSPFVFYTQAEISKHPSCPFSQWPCTPSDLARGVEHLEMMNVSQLIVRTDEIKGAARQHPELVRELAAGDYEIYRVTANENRYVVPVTAAPALVLERDWRTAAFRWFPSADSEAPLPVFAPSATEAERASFALVFDQLPETIPRREYETRPEITEEIGRERIGVRNCKPGHPLFIRISYHPRWRATGGERVWLAGPGMMLVIPKTTELELVYGDPPLVKVGWALSALGWILVPLLARVRRPSGSAR